MKTYQETSKSENGIGRWLTKRKLAEYLGISERCIDLTIRQFLTPHYPGGIGGRRILFDREEVDAYLLKQRDEHFSI